MQSKCGLQLPVTEKHYRDLVGSSLTNLQNRIRGTKVVIVDEFTMMNQTMFFWLDRRCRQGTGRNDVPFGGLVVVLVGDPAQLPPVTGNPVWNTAAKGKFNVDALGLYLSKFVKVVQLKGSNRLDDVPTKQRFQEFQDRLRNGTNTLDDHEWFNSYVTEDNIIARIGENRYNEQFKSNKSNWFFNTNEELYKHNIHQLQKTEKPIIRINAVHNRTKAKAVSSSQFRNLEAVCYLSVNALVMYTANSSFPYKIVNGSVGVVKDILYATGESPPNDLPVAVIVEFDSYCGPPLFTCRGEDNSMIPINGTNKWVPVIPITAECEYSSVEGELTRTQLPLKLTWGYTGWKAQGSTFRNPIGVILGNKERCDGLTYTNISRCTNIENLCISQGVSYERLTTEITKSSRYKHRIIEENRLYELFELTKISYEECMHGKVLCPCNCGRDVNNPAIMFTSCLLNRN